MFVIKFSLTGGFVELYFKTREAADAAFEAYLKPSPKTAKAFSWTDDYNRHASIPYATVNAAQIFGLDDEFDCQIVIMQRRNDANMREQQRVQQRVQNGIIMPAARPSQLQG